MRNNNKSTLIIIVSVLLFAAFISVSFFNYRTSTFSIRKEIVNSSLPLLRENIYSDIQKMVTPPLNVSSVMASDSFLIEWALAGEKDSEPVQQYLREIRNKYGYFSTFFVSAQTGNYYYYDGILKQVSPEDSHDVWFYNFIDSGKQFVLDVDTNEAADNRMTIFVNFRLEDFEGNLLGVTGVGLEMESFSAFLKNKESVYNRKIYFVNKEGLIQAHSDASQIEKGNVMHKPGIREIASMLLDPSGDPVNLKYAAEHDHYFVTSRYMPEVEWFLIVEQDEDKLLKSARRTLWRTLLVGFIVSVFVIIVTAITIRRYQQRLEKLAVTDELTGCNNRREFQHRFEVAEARYERYGAPISMIILDIDHFKTINDTCGHLQGDEVLKSVASLLLENTRPGDMVARWGGDEFVLLLECALHEAETTAERIRSGVVSVLPECEAAGGKAPTISLGVAEYDGKETLENLLARADQALLQSKEMGRNRVTSAPPAQEP